MTISDFLADRKVRENRLTEHERIARGAERCMTWFAIGCLLFVLGLVQ